MIKLTEKRFADYLRRQPETGMGYWIVTVYLKDGRVFPQVAVNSGIITRVRNFDNVPFVEADIDHLEVTHDKWNWHAEK